MHDGKDDHPVADFYEVETALEYLRWLLETNAENNEFSIVKT